MAVIDWSVFTPPSGMKAREDLWGTYSSWNAPVWGAGNTQYDRYTGYQGDMNSLLSRIKEGPQASDNQAAMDAIAQMYGYSPASWTAMVGGQADRMSASNVMANAGNIAAGMADTPYGQEQAKGMRAAQQEAVAGMQKQLEAIFGDRGSVGGMSAAYEMTNQLQSTFLQAATKNNLEMFDRALSSINSENQYYQGLITNGTIQAQDYLKFRWDALQTGYQDYMMAMDQALKEWTTMEQVSEDQWQAAQDNISRQIAAMDGQLALEMGIEQDQLNMIRQIAEDAAAALDPEKNPAAQTVGGGMMAAGTAMFMAGANPASIVVGGVLTAGVANVGLMVVGGLMFVFGGLIAWLGG
jgi:hypothetical protein